ncbi:MAG TPA: gamma-glutamyltransferase [Polyangiaceae bacterium]|nr:gamma-glutamyltransferase [Polyangiaceae bacterium]
MQRRSTPLQRRPSAERFRRWLTRALGPAAGGALALGLVLAAPAPGGAVPGAREGAATESRLATQTALAELKRGGSAVDAVIAAAFVAGVVAPTSSGLGGGGVALVYRASDHSFTALDFRETAPAVLDAEAFERRPLPDAERGKLTGVPGEARGLAWLHARFGKRPWAELVEPAERCARDGFAVEPHLASVLGGKDQARYRLHGIDPSFWPGGKPAALGRRVKRPALAKTLETLAKQGAPALYQGALADDFVAAARKFGGTLTSADLAKYEPRVRVPLRVKWEDLEIITMPPPSAGGLLLAEVLGMFSRQELMERGVQNAKGIRPVAMAMRAAIADRNQYVGDPDRLPVDLQRVLAPERLRARKERLFSTPAPSVKQLVGEDHGTHALVVADREGNVVSLTTTVNDAFGAEIAAEASGIVLNDELDDFTSLQASKALGVRFPPNVARPGARPTSSMMPTIVLRGGVPMYALGGSGGFAIAPSVTETLLRLLAGTGGVEEAVRAPRYRIDFHDHALVLDTAFGDAVRQDLERAGETVRMGDGTAAVQVLGFGPGGMTGASDPRKGGVALVR